MTKAEFLTKNVKYLSEGSAAALDQVPDAQWAAVLDAAGVWAGGKPGEPAVDGQAEPGIECDVVATHDTLAEFDDARLNHWSEQGRRLEITIEGLPARKFERFQLARGGQRKDMVVVDLGDLRIALV
jgi:hypothetical protein